MSDLTLTKARLSGGVWTGILTGHDGDAAPKLKLTHKGDALPGLATVRQDDGSWLVDAPVAIDRLADGVQTFVISDADSAAVLASFAFVSGEALAEDIRAEMDLLRDELDMLKRAFRRHCVETAQEE